MYNGLLSHFQCLAILYRTFFILHFPIPAIRPCSLPALAIGQATIPFSVYRQKL